MGRAHPVLPKRRGTRLLQYARLIRDPNQAHVPDLFMPEYSKTDIEVRSRHVSVHIESDREYLALLQDGMNVLQI